MTEEGNSERNLLYDRNQQDTQNCKSFSKHGFGVVTGLSAAPVRIENWAGAGTWVGIECKSNQGSQFSSYIITAPVYQHTNL